MGPNVLWLTDALTQVLDLRPGMRVLDMGCGTHSAMWWRELWEQSREVRVEHAEMLDDGWDLWWQFCEASAAWSGKPVMEVGDAEMLTSTRSLGFTRVIARREAVE